MSERISPLKVKNLFLNNTQNIDAVLPGIEYKHPICPFTMLYGAVNSTEGGYKPYNSVPTDYTSFARVYTGEEPVIVQWDNSLTLTQPGNQKNAWTKSWQVGHVMLGYMLENSSVMDWYQNNVEDQDVTQAVKRKNTYIINRQVAANLNYTPDNITFADSDFFKMYQLPLESVNNIDISTKIISGTGQFNRTNQVSRQWFTIDSVVNVFNSKGQYVHSIVSFASLNDRISKTGIAIGQYVQLGAPGEGMPFPQYKDTAPFKVQLDTELINDRPVTHMQIDLFAPVGFHSVMCWGRPVQNGESTTVEVQAPRMLIPINPAPPINDPIKFTSAPTRNYVVLTGGGSNNNSALDIDSWYNQWQERASTYYNNLQQKQFEGHIGTDYTTTSATNTENADGNYSSYWDEDWTFALKGTSGMNANPYWVDAKGNGQSHDPKQNFLFDYSKFKTNGKFSLAELNFFNYMTALHVMELPWNVRETVFWQLKDVPFIGGFLNQCTGGFPVGWRDVQSKVWPGVPPLNCLWPKTLYEWVQNTLYAEQSSTTAGKWSSLWAYPTAMAATAGFIPSDFFRDGDSNRLQSLLGASSYSSAFLFQLTDVVSIRSTNTADNTINQAYETITTEKLGQFPYNPATDTIDPTRKYLVNDTISFIPSNLLNKYLIDGIEVKALGKCDYKITFYSSLDNKGNVIPPQPDNSSAIWIGYYQTQAKVTNQLTNWHNHMILSNYANADNYRDTNTHFTYPQQLPTPKIEGVLRTERQYLNNIWYDDNSLDWEKNGNTAAQINFKSVNSQPIILADDWADFQSMQIKVSNYTKERESKAWPYTFQPIDFFREISVWDTVRSVFDIDKSKFVQEGTAQKYVYTEITNNPNWNWQPVDVDYVPKQMTFKCTLDLDANTTTIEIQFNMGVPKNDPDPEGFKPDIWVNLVFNYIDYYIRETGENDYTQNVNQKFTNTYPNVTGQYYLNQTGNPYVIQIDAVALKNFANLDKISFNTVLSRPNLSWYSPDSTPNNISLAFNPTADQKQQINFVFDISVTQDEKGVYTYTIVNPTIIGQGLTEVADGKYTKTVYEASNAYTLAFDNVNNPTTLTITPVLNFEAGYGSGATTVISGIDWSDLILTIQYLYQ